MNPKSLIRFAFLVILAAGALAVGAYLMPRFNPYYAGVPNVSRSEAQEVVDRFAQAQQFDLSEYFLDAFFMQDGTGIDYLMRTRGVAPTIPLANSEELPLASWLFYYYKNVPRDAQAEYYYFFVSISGKLLGFLHSLPDSTSGANLSQEAAHQLAESFLAGWPDIDLDAFILDEVQSEVKPKRTDYSLVYKRFDDAYGRGSKTLSIHVSGDEVSSVILRFEEPPEFAAASGVVGGANVLFNSLSGVIYILVTVLGIVVFLRKYHAGEISVKRGFIASAILYGSMLIASLNSWGAFAFGTGIGQVSYLFTKYIVLGIQIATIWAFMAINTFTTWNAGVHEITRLKPRLLSGINSIIHGKWITKNVGAELPVGALLGTLLFGAIQLFNYFLVQTGGVVPRVGSVSFSCYSAALPLLCVLTSIVSAILFSEVVFRLFFISYLIRKLKSPLAAIVISALFFSGFSIFFKDTYSFWPAYFTLLPALLIGLVQGYIFWRHGLLAAMASAALYYSWEIVLPMFASDAGYFQWNALAALFLPAGLFVLGGVSAWRGKRFEFVGEEEPAHIRRIKEKTRLQKELEIARKVQLGLLPKEQPALAGYDIAGICLPALEVGGDYFDFIRLETGNLGIAVGDVSGKGVPAAIYMTLTKGILQSHAEAELSPKQVLSKVNHIMYRTIERSWYVSMFYAVLDIERKMLRYARAGHNPAIVLSKRQKEPQLLQSGGIGLGLEHGEIFSKTLVEATLELSPGDTLVFYTDGFTEAMNERGEELGEDRFLELLRNGDNGSAEALARNTVQAIRNFAGSAPQHDDMTMVVLKVH